MVQYIVDQMFRSGVANRGGRKGGKVGLRDNGGFCEIRWGKEWGELKRKRGIGRR